MDRLHLQGMHFHALHGVYDEEKVQGNEFEVSVSFSTDLSKEGASDDLQEAIDYGQVYKSIEKIMKGPSADLIEHLAWKIGNNLWQEYHSRCESLTVSITKMNPPVDGDLRQARAELTWPRS